MANEYDILYWEETLDEILDIHGIKVTREQLIALSRDVAISCSVQGEMMGSCHSLGRRIRIGEKAKIVCPQCKGLGHDIQNVMGRVVISRCVHCNGSGKIRND